MKKTIFQYLQWSNPKPMANSAEEEFFYHHASNFNSKTNIYNDTSSIYGLIRACIILEGERNREELDYFLQTFPKEALSLPSVMKNAKNKLPYLKKGSKRIYIPTLNEEVNDLYYRDMKLLLDGKYEGLFKGDSSFYVDPFETYGRALFDSTFTRLIRLDIQENDLCGFYHPFFETVFILDNKGCLVQEIPLFDEKLKYPNKENLFERLDELMKSYFSADRERFLTSLKDLKLISQQLYEDIKNFLGEQIK